MKFCSMSLAGTCLILICSMSATAQQFMGNGFPIHQAGGGSAMYFDPAIRYASCDACDAYGDPLGEGCPPGAGAGPYGGTQGYGGAAGFSQCGPHYFDVAADLMYMRRERTAEPLRDFTSLGIDGPRILSSNNTELDYEPGFRIVGRYDIGAVSLVEVAYFGTFDWSSSAQVESATGQLFSAFTAFGTDPFAGAGFEETDNATLHRISISSQLDNAEINWRQYWVAPHPSLTGTILAGARWTRLEESFLWHTESALGEFDNNTSTLNNMVGFQVGADAMWCIFQGFRLTAEGKAGIFNNHAKQRTVITATTSGPIVETAESDHVAFVGEGSIGFVADLLPSWSLRGGYQTLILTSVALSANNVNFDRSAGFAPTNVFLEDGGEAVYHGFYLGAEYVYLKPNSNTTIERPTATAGRPGPTSNTPVGRSALPSGPADRPLPGRHPLAEDSRYR